MSVFVLICREFYADQKFQKGSLWENRVQNGQFGTFMSLGVPIWKS